MFIFDSEEDYANRLQQAINASSSESVERWLHSEIEACVSTIRATTDHSDEEIFDLITESHSGDMTEFEVQTLAKMLGIS